MQETFIKYTWSKGFTVQKVHMSIYEYKEFIEYKQSTESAERAGGTEGAESTESANRVQ